MAHKFPPGLSAIIASGWARSRPYVDITLRSGAHLYFSTHSAPFGLVQYQGKLRTTAGLRLSLTQRIDRVELSATNVDMQLGLDTLDAEDALTHATASFGKFVGSIRDLGELYKIELVPGEIVEAVGTEREMTFKVVRDLEAGGAVIGNQPIQKLCRLPYKGEGCESTDASPTCLHTWIDCGLKAPAPRLVTIAPYAGNQPSYGGDALYKPDRVLGSTPRRPFVRTLPVGIIPIGGEEPERWPRRNVPTLVPFTVV